MFAWRDQYVSYNGAGATDPYWNSVSFLDSFDVPVQGSPNLTNNSTFKDMSASNLTMSAGGTSAYYAGFSPFGNQYPGSLFVATSYLNSTQNVNIGTTGTFTVEGWVYFTATGAEKTVAANFASGIGGWYLSVSSTSTVKFSDGLTRDFNFTTTFTANAWHHLAVTYDGTTLKAYIDGVSDASSFTTSNLWTTLSNPMSVGRLNLSGDFRYFPGYIACVRVTRSLVYTTNFTPSTVPLSALANTIALIRMDVGGYQDLSITGNKITNTATNAAVSTAQAKFGPQSGSFTATGYMTVIDSTPLQFSSGDFTIEGWVYRTASGATQGIISKGAINAGWSVYINTSNQLSWASGSNAALKTSTTTIPATTWTYFAIVRSGTTGYMFINGTQEGATFTEAGSFTQTNNMYIGADRFAANGLTGYLDDIRVTKGVARYTASFSAPGSAFPTSL